MKIKIIAMFFVNNIIINNIIMDNNNLYHDNQELSTSVDFNSYNTFGKSDFGSFYDGKLIQQHKYVVVEEEENDHIPTRDSKNALTSLKYTFIISVPFIIINLCSIIIAPKYSDSICLQNTTHHVISTSLPLWLIIGAIFSSFNIFMAIIDSYYDYNCTIGCNPSTKYSSWGIVQIVNGIVLRLILIPTLISIIIYELSIVYKPCNSELLPLCVITIIFIMAEILKCIFYMLKCILFKLFMMFMDGMDN